MKKIKFVFFCLVAFAVSYGQDIKEPEFTFQVNYLDKNGELGAKLETQVPKAKHAAYSYTYKFEVNGNKSFTRIDDAKPSFIVNMGDNSKDIEGVIHIYKIESKGNKRKGAYKSRNPSGDESYVAFKFIKYGDSSYKLTTNNPLDIGEYMIVIWVEGARKVSLFGID
jgi:hypothetical protein